MLGAHGIGSAANQPVRERRNQLEHPPYTKPELVATGANETCLGTSLDCSDRHASYFYLYVLLDIFSRYVVGWMVAERETPPSATLIEQTCLAASSPVLTLHSDRGAPMTSKWRRFGLATTSGSGAGLAPLASGSGGLVAPLLNPQSPSAHLVQCAPPH